MTSAKLPLDQSLNHTICDVYTPKAAEINFNTREMLRILFLFIVCDIHFFGFIEALDSKEMLRTLKKVLRQPHNTPTLQASLSLRDKKYFAYCVSLFHQKYRSFKIYLEICEYFLWD